MVAAATLALPATRTVRAFRTFRRTVATLLDEAGLTARQIADLLGHSRPSMTQDVYMGRRSPGRAAADALGAVIPVSEG